MLFNIAYLYVHVVTLLVELIKLKKKLPEVPLPVVKIAPL
jgi:hypothetical protein